MFHNFGFYFSACGCWICCNGIFGIFSYYLHLVAMDVKNMLNVIPEVNGLRSRRS